MSSIFSDPRNEFQQFAQVVNMLWISRSICSTACVITVFGNLWIFGFLRKSRQFSMNFCINSAVFIKNTVHFFQPALIFDDFDAKTAFYSKFCRVNEPLLLFKIALLRDAPPDSYPHRRIELVDKICYYKIESLSTGGALLQTIYWRWRSSSWTSLLPPFPLGLTT